MRPNFFYFLIIIALLFSCEKDPQIHSFESAPLKISMKVNVDGNSLTLNDPIYFDYMDRAYQLELLKFYLSNWFLEKSDGTLVSVKDVCLYDFESDSVLEINTSIDTGQYVQLHFGVGLDPNLNSSDPVIFETSHPLSYSQNTYWTWASKYKFFMIEGRVYPSGIDNPNQIFSYHSGLDSLYREVNIPLGNINIDSNGILIDIQLDIADVINGSAGSINLVDNSFSHTFDHFEIVEIMSNNLLDAFNCYVYELSCIIE